MYGYVPASHRGAFKLYDYRLHYPAGAGVPFTNAIRDIADGDYISGSVRMLDALLVFFCIALGVGLMFTVYSRVTGGAIL